jgi:hypothetical protein
VVEHAGLAERVVAVRFLVADHARDQTGDGLDHDESGQLSPRDDVVADRELLGG